MPRSGTGDSAIVTLQPHIFLYLVFQTTDTIKIRERTSTWIPRRTIDPISGLKMWCLRSILIKWSTVYTYSLPIDSTPMAALKSTIRSRPLGPKVYSSWFEIRVADRLPLHRLTRRWKWEGRRLDTLGTEKRKELDAKWLGLLVKNM